MSPRLNSSDAPPQAAAEGRAAAGWSFPSRVALVTIVVVGLVLAWLARDMLLLIFAGILLAVFLDGLATGIAKYTPIPRGVALGLVLLTMAVLTVMMVLFLGNELAQQIDKFDRTLGEAVQQARSRLENYEWGRAILRGIAPGNASATAADSAPTMLPHLAGFVSAGVGAVAAPLIVLVIGIYLAVDPRLYRRGLLALVPPARRTRAKEIMAETNVALWGWLLGRLFSMTLIGITTGVGLWLLGVPLALSLAIIAFFCNFMPYLGPPLSALPAILIALSLSPTTVLYVLALYAALQLLESYLLTPLVEQRSVELPPGFTLGTQMIFGVLFGALGLLFATPLAALAVVLVKTLYVEDVLGDTGEEKGTSVTASGPPAAD